MGLSSTQVPGDQQGLSWTETLKQSSTLDLPKPPPTRRNQERQQQQQSERLECPRCGSTNTKFCYYNNYNKLQPRYFCKACKRHWTKGGILRNVPVGGGRKNKRVKPSSATTSTTTSTTSSVSISNGSSHSKAHIFGPSQQSSCQALDAVSDQDRLFGAIRPSSTSQQDAIDRFSGKNPLRNECTFTFSTLSSQENQNVQFSFASHVSALDNIPSSTTTSYPHKDGYGCCTKNQDTSLDSTITTTMPTTSSIFSQPWQDPTPSGAMDVPNYWNWNDIDTFISADLDTTWDDDTEIKF